MVNPLLLSFESVTNIEDLAMIVAVEDWEQTVRIGGTALNRRSNLRFEPALPTINHFMKSTLNICKKVGVPLHMLSIFDIIVLYCARMEAS